MDIISIISNSSSRASNNSRAWGWEWGSMMADLRGWDWWEWGSICSIGREGRDDEMM